LDAKDVKPPTKAEMQRLIKAMNGPVDTSEMAEWTSEDFRKAIRGSAPSVAKSSATKRGSRGEKSLDDPRVDQNLIFRSTKNQLGTDLKRDALSEP